MPDDPLPGHPGWVGPPPGWYVPPPGAPRPQPRWRTPLPEPAVPPRYGIGDVALGLGVWVVVNLAVGLLAARLIPARGAAIIVAQLAGLAVFAGWPVLVSRRKGSGSIRDDFGWRILLPHDLFIGVLAGIVIVFASGVVRLVLTALTRSGLSTNAQAVFGGQHTSAGVAVMIVLAALGAPVAEELFFRGLALRAFERRWGPAWGIVLSTAVFASLHVIAASGAVGARLILVVGIAVYGGAFGALTWVTGRLAPSIVGHVCINTLATVAYFALANQPA